MTKTLALPRLLGAIGIALLIFLMHLPATRDAILFDDSADYMRAAQSSALSTWLNTNSAAPWELLHMRKSDPAFRERPWDALYAAGDNAALRHFHSPVSYYPMHFVRALFATDHAVRVMADVVAAVTCGLLFFALAAFDVPLAVAAWFAIFAGLGSRYVEVSVDPTPHVWYILFSLVFLFCFSRFLLSGKPRDLYLTAVSLGLCFSTLEFTVELIASIPVALALAWLTQRPFLAPRRPLLPMLVRAVGVFLLTTFLVWPGGWFRGGYLETYGVLSATVLFKNKSAFGEHLTAGLIYRVVFAGHLVLLLLTLAWVIAAVWLLVKRRLSIPGIVFSTYTLFAFLLGVADHFRLNTYVSEFVVFAVGSAGLVLNSLLGAQPLSTMYPANDRALTVHAERLRPAAYVAIVLLLVAGSFTEWRLRHNDWSTRPWLAQTFATIQNTVPAGESLLVNNNREALSLYLPAYRFEPTTKATSADPRTPARVANAHFGIFDTPLDAPADTHILARVPEGPDHTAVLWQK